MNKYLSWILKDLCFLECTSEMQPHSMVIYLHVLLMSHTHSHLLKPFTYIQSCITSFCTQKAAVSSFDHELKHL